MMRQDRFTEGAQEVLAAICHSERSEESGAGRFPRHSQTLRFAQGDRSG